MSFLCNNFAAVVVAAVSMTIVWMFGGTRGELLLPVVPWLFLFLCEVLICFPMRREEESTYDARHRVWKNLKHDPFFWTALGFLALLAVPFLNYGLCLNCDAKLIAQGVPAEPPVPVIPFCVDRLDHLNVFLWFVTALPTAVVVRHSLNGRGKRLLLEILVWNGALLALFGFVQGALSAPGPFWNTQAGNHIAKPGDFFSVFGYPNMGGDYFTVLFCVAAALWRWRVDEIKTEERAKDISKIAEPEHGRFWRKHYHLIPAALCFFAALNTLSRAAIILVTLSAAVVFAHSFFSFLAHHSKADKVRKGVWWALAFSLVVFAAAIFMPEDLQREVDTLGTSEVLDRVSGRGQYHARVATELWKDHKLFGCGGWGYIHFCASKMTKKELKQMQMVGGANVHNDHLQFLAEHGLVGFGLLVVMVLLLLAPLMGRWRHLAKEAQFITDKKRRPPSPVQLFALPGSAFFLVIAVLCTFVHAFGDCPLRSPAVLTLYFTIFAALPGFFFPKGH